MRPSPGGSHGGGWCARPDGGPRYHRLRRGNTCTDAGKRNGLPGARYRSPAGHTGTCGQCRNSTSCRVSARSGLSRVHDHGGIPRWQRSVRGKYERKSYLLGHPLNLIIQLALTAGTRSPTTRKTFEPTSILESRSIVSLMIFLSRKRQRCGLQSMNGATLVVVLLLSGCASQPQSITGETPTPTLRRELHRLEDSEEHGQQLADYLRIAQITSQRLDQTQPAVDQSGIDSPITIYDRAVTDFVVSWSDQGRPQVIQDTKTGRNTRLLISHSSDTTWSPTYFASFENTQRVDRRRFWKSTDRSGLGGTLIGIHPTVIAGGAAQRLKPPKGFRIAVTALLRFSDHPTPNQTEVQLDLVCPRIQDSVRLGKRRYSLAADFTAPAAAYAKINEFWVGFLNMVRGERTESKSGLRRLEPYDPNPVPIVFVHGLLSSGFTWLNVTNAVRAGSGGSETVSDLGLLLSDRKSHSLFRIAIA